MRTVGIDVGGTKCLGVALDEHGVVLAEGRRPTPRGDGSLTGLIDTLVELANALGPFDELGVGVPGLVTNEGVLRAAPNLDGVADFDVAGRLSEQIGQSYQSAEVRSQLWFPPTPRQIARLPGFIFGARIRANAASSAVCGSSAEAPPSADASSSVAESPPPRRRRASRSTLSLV